MPYIVFSVLFLLAIYLPNFCEGYFLIDDLDLIGAPQLSSHVEFITKIKNIFTPSSHVDYYPFRDITYLFDWIWGVDLSNNLFPAKLQNFFWFIVCGYLFFQILQSLKIPDQWAGIFTFIWLVHPYNSELLLWVSARKDLLSIVFTLAGIRELLNREMQDKNHIKSFQKLEFLKPIFYFLLASLSKAGLLLVPIAILFYFLCFRGNRIKFSTKAILVVTSLINMGILFFQKRQYSLWNDMSFAYSASYRVQASLTALGKMLAGLFYFPAIIIDCDNWGEWADLNGSYLPFGLMAVVFLIGFMWKFRKSDKLWIFIFIAFSIYILIPGPNIYHRNFFSTRYFTPIFLLMIAALAKWFYDKGFLPKKPPIWIFIFLASFCFLVQQESFHWLTNKAIWDKSVETTKDQPNALMNRLLTYAEILRWGRASAEDIKVIRSDSEKLEKICLEAAKKNNRNGSLCFTYWRSLPFFANAERHPQIFKLPSSSNIQILMTEYFKEIEMLKEKDFQFRYIPINSNSKMSDTFGFQKYKYYRAIGLDNMTVELRVFRLIDECLYGDKDRARTLFKQKVEQGLLHPISLYEMRPVDGILEEKRAFQKCFRK